MLMPTPGTTVRSNLDQWFDALDIRPRVIGEFDDSELRWEFGATGIGVFSGPLFSKDLGAEDSLYASRLNYLMVALRRARYMGGEEDAMTFDKILILLCAVRAKTLSGTDPVDAQVGVTSEAADYLEAAAARLRAEGVSGVRTSVFLIRAEGTPAEAPVQWAAGPPRDEDRSPVRERAGFAQPHAARPHRRHLTPRSFRGYAD
jgi:hypothetical protein